MKTNETTTLENLLKSMFYTAVFATGVLAVMAWLPGLVDGVCEWALETVTSVC